MSRPATGPARTEPVLAAVQYGGVPPPADRDLGREIRLLEERRRQISSALINVEDLLTARGQERWSHAQLKSVEDDLKGTEVKFESLALDEVEITCALEYLDGFTRAEARKSEAVVWERGILARLSIAKRSLWDMLGKVAPDPKSNHKTSFLEKVQLPSFSGKVGDYPDFKGQFRELAANDGYTSVIELAQLRRKLHVEGRAIVEGVMGVEEAWSMLDDRYGNAEVAVVTTLQALQRFRTSKSSWHEAIQELFSAVQKCLATLSRLGKAEELYSDRQTIASVISQLPASARERWVHQPGVSEMTQSQKGKYLVQWLTTERKAALQVHLEELSRGVQPVERPKPPPAAHKEEISSFSTNSAEALPVDNRGVVPGTGGGGGGSGSRQSTRPGLTDVTSAESAQAVATKRDENLTKRGLNKCPSCTQTHYYTKTWDKVDGRPSAQMTSTFLSSCPSFLQL